MTPQQQSLVPSEVITKDDAEKRQIELVKEKFDATKYNQIFYTSTVIDMLPAGVQMVPTVIQIPEHEMWNKATNKELTFLPDGMVELAAPAIKRIGMVAGVKLEKWNESLTTVTIPEKYISARAAKTWPNGGKSEAQPARTEPARQAAMLNIEYRASMLMPDGSVHSEVAGKEEEYTGQHAREKIDAKAKRNAIKALLNIPLTIPKANIEKPFIVFKPVFRRGASPETDAILDRIEGAKANAMDMLYGNKAVAALPSTNQDSGEVGLAELMEMMRTAPELSQLETLVQSGMDIPKTEMQRKAWLEVMQTRKAELEGPKL